MLTKHKQFILITLFLPLIVASFEDRWTHHLFLDSYEKYLLQWKTNETEQMITFLATVQTTGWIGFGLSPNGGMKNSDIVIGWVNDDGKTFFHDRHAIGESMPVIDDSQDFNLLYSAQNQTHTTLMFSRHYTTCDQINDIEIIAETMRLIYAYGETDPQSIDRIQIHNHQHRGSRSAILLANKLAMNIEEESELQFTEFATNNIIIPNKYTTYWCKLFKVQFSQKRHVIKYLPNITPGNEEFLHHITVFACGHPESHKLDKYLGNEGLDCTESANMPIDLTYCLRPYFVWAVGGEPFIAPPEAGFPIGYDEETTYLLFQPHYTNPDLISGRKDSSGLRMYHTSNLRLNDAFTFTVGSVIDYGLIIPPKQTHFQVTGHCDTECIKDSMPETGINFFAALPHAHLLGKKIKTRHFRGETELPWLMDENNYDFNYQQFRALRTHVSVFAGDLITTECTYDSSATNFARLGGEATSDEMCMTFFSYYPRIKNNSQMCFSGLTPATVMSISGVEQISGYGPNRDPVIQLPKTLQNSSLSQYLRTKTDWDYELIERSKYMITNAPQKQNCYWIKSPNDVELDHLVSYPKSYKPYSPPVRTCLNSSLQQSFTNSYSFTHFSHSNHHFIIIFAIFLTIHCI